MVLDEKVEILFMGGKVVLSPAGTYKNNEGLIKNSKAKVTVPTDSYGGLSPAVALAMFEAVAQPKNIEQLKKFASN